MGGVDVVLGVGAQDSRRAGTFVSFSLSVLKFVLGVALGGGGGRAVTIKDLSKLTLFFLLIFDSGYLSGEDVRGRHGGTEAAADRDGGGVLTEDAGGGSDNEEIFLVYKEEEARTKSSCLLYTSPSPRDRQKSRMPSSA